MKYRALYRETRPEVFSQVLGQENVVKILRHQIATDSVNHAYLFCGTRGTGKTTMARILAKAVNCTDDRGGEKPCGVCPSCRAIAEGSFIDVMEIDAASNNGVDNVRELRESVNYPPAVGKKKVYIIDEVHMMSGAAFNALLKTLEEPPEHAMFILATTDPEKLPQTILSRCQRMDFRRVSAEVLAGNMKKIAGERGVTITPDALRLLASNADGSVRDSLSLLEQCLASGEKELDRDMVLDFLGAAPVDFYLDLTEQVSKGDISQAFLLIDQAAGEGKDIRQLMKDWMAHLRNLMITKYVKDAADMLNLSEENIALLRKQSAGIELDWLNRGIVTLARAINDSRYSTQTRILMEVAAVTLANGGIYGNQEDERVSVSRRGKQISQQISRYQPKDSAEPAEEKSSSAQVRRREERPVSAGDEAENAVRQERPKAFRQDENSKSASEVTDPGELTELWQSVIEEASSGKPSLGMLRNGSSLTGLGTEEYRVLITMDFQRKMLEENRRLFNRIMSERMGRPMNAALTSGENAEEGISREDKLNRLADKASAILGVKTEVR